MTEDKPEERNKVLKQLSDLLEAAGGAEALVCGAVAPGGGDDGGDADAPDGGGVAPGAEDEFRDLWNDVQTVRAVVPTDIRLADRVAHALEHSDSLDVLRGWRTDFPFDSLRYVATVPISYEGFSLADLVKVADHLGSFGKFRRGRGSPLCGERHR